LREPMDRKRDMEKTNKSKKTRATKSFLSGVPVSISRFPSPPRGSLIPKQRLDSKIERQGTNMEGRSKEEKKTRTGVDIASSSGNSPF
jgi:hypothetical protein